MLSLNALFSRPCTVTYLNYSILLNIKSAEPALATYVRIIPISYRLTINTIEQTDTVFTCPGTLKLHHRS